LRGSTGRIECVEDAEVRLERDGTVIRLTATDAFGDFKFEALPPDGTAYVVNVAHASRGAARLTASVSESVNLGMIELTLPP